MNLTKDYFKIKGLRIDVSEAALAELVTGLPRIRYRWFFQKRQNLIVVKDFLTEGERVQPKSKGITLDTLPRPWD